jgi:hypothetical protein
MVEMIERLEKKRDTLVRENEKLKHDNKNKKQLFGSSSTHTGIGNSRYMNGSTYQSMTGGNPAL